jgi:hypothetical protein
MSIRASTFEAICHRAAPHCSDPGNLDPSSAWSKFEAKQEQAEIVDLS